MHDDIMDEAPIRRGQPTVHSKWNTNTAILSGDAMFIRSFEFLKSLQPDLLSTIMPVFLTCSYQVCEGQQLDMVFEKRERVSIEEYLHMIEFKTAVLLGYSLELGAMLARQGEHEREQLKKFGINLGIGFQIKDDILDVYGKHEKVGKQVGGDIISNKKTFLLLSALELAKGNDKKDLKKWLDYSGDPERKVHAIRTIYDKLGIEERSTKKMKEYFERAFKELCQIKANTGSKNDLIEFTRALVNRQY
jgi:geranylgeranyl diphosphate synthase type II